MLGLIGKILNDILFFAFFDLEVKCFPLKTLFHCELLNIFIFSFRCLFPVDLHLLFINSWF